MSEIQKIRPIARAKYSDGNDGRDWHYYVAYYCPTCQKPIFHYETACDKCGTFFDWSKKAHIKITYTAVYED